ncbi:MAG TPA: aspartate-semialdehyde dehydrogenase [Solirubrobacterales bacterium]|nr:aspartate-semialdehyde dehydrogenase [Solirubrobacterales bacterium]
MAGDGYRVGVLGATGLVGTTILELLADRDFPIAELRPLASERSAGKEIEWRGGALSVQAVGEDSIQGLDIVLSSAGGSVSSEWTPKLVEAGATVVDNTSYWRMHDDVPLVVSEVNPDALTGHKGIIANPNCSTMQMVVALKPLYDAAGIERLVISTYQAVSGTGKSAIDELRAQARAAVSGSEMPKPRVYPHQIAFNVLAQAGSFATGDDHTDEERKLMNETRKILGDPGIKVSATCIRVPVVTGHSEAVNVETREPLDPDQARELLEAAPGVTVVDDPAEGAYPMAIEATGKDDVFVGRIRRDPGNERALDLWIVADNLRKGAATNAVQLAELLVERGLVGQKQAA